LHWHTQVCFTEKLMNQMQRGTLQKCPRICFLQLYSFHYIVSLLIPEGIKLFVKNPKLWEAIDTVRIILFSNCIFSIFQGFGIRISL
jgi:hypothetical protein